jgi:hypothetical protein
VQDLRSGDSAPVRIDGHPSPKERLKGDGMSTDELAYGEQLPAPRQRGPAFGEAGPPHAAKAEKEDAGPLDRRAEAMMGLAIVAPVLATCVAIGYSIYTVVSSSL